MNLIQSIVRSALAAATTATLCAFVSVSPASAQIIVIHCWEIIMHERIAVNHFESRSYAQHASSLNTQKARRFDYKKGAQAFAAAERGIAHCF